MAKQKKKSNKRWARKHIKQNKDHANLTTFNVYIKKGRQIK